MNAEFRGIQCECDGRTKVYTSADGEKGKNNMTGGDCCDNRHLSRLATPSLLPLRE